MKTRCPCCGAENSLDALIAHEQARQSLWMLANIGGPMTLGLVKYLGLFRPNKSALSQARMASLMAELLPDIQAGQIYRNGQSYPAPVAAWAYAFNEVLAARRRHQIDGQRMGGGHRLSEYQLGRTVGQRANHRRIYPVICRNRTLADTQDAD